MSVNVAWALCLDTHMKLALYKYAIIIIIIIMCNIKSTFQRQILLFSISWPDAWLFLPILCEC